jgi:hypothetical protein
MWRGVKVMDAAVLLVSLGILCGEIIKWRETLEQPSLPIRKEIRLNGDIYPLSFDLLR